MKYNIQLVNSTAARITRDKEDRLKPATQLDLYRTFSYYSPLNNMMM